MLKNWKIYLVGLGGLLLGSALMIGSTVLADDSTTTQNKWQENKEVIKEAIENEDYAAWKEAVGENCPANKISEEDFPKLVEVYRLAEEGKFKEVRKIKEELGLSGKGFGKKGKTGINLEQKEEVWQALKTGDYEAWKNTIKGRKMADKIDENEFAKLVEAHNLQKEGKFTEAQEIKEELGLKKGPRWSK